MNRKVKSHMKSSGEPIAVVGMACRFPKAPDLETFWKNILHKVDAVTEVPPDRWDPERFYDPEAADGLKLYGKRGGYLESPFAFDPSEFGIMPKAVEGGEPDQFLVLKTAADALADAGIAPAGANHQAGNQADHQADHERTAFILGRGSYLSAGAFNLVQRTMVVDQTVEILKKMHPDLSADAAEKLKTDLLASLKPFEAETAPSVMPNITAGRVANRLGFMGPNYTIDAACASSLLAIDAASAALSSGRSDLALAGGVHIFNNLPFLNVFCALGAMSRSDRIRPFDARADGMMPGEGVGIVVLKRLSDAQRDNNRIYAAIQGIGSASDGKGISVAAPRVEGEVLALQRAYEAAGIGPDTVSLIEAHGTATAAGDAAEIASLGTVFGKKADGGARYCALGTVKSMIGHAMPAAGIAGFIKTALALYYKVLPPSLHCEEPNPKFCLEETPFYINTETRPWFQRHARVPRRAGLNAFGFGGINAHVLLEEHAPADPAHTPAPGPCALAWEAALFLFSADSRAGLSAACRHLREQVAASPESDLMALAHAVLCDYSPRSQRLAVIAESLMDLSNKLDYAIGKLEKANCKKIKDIKGIYYFSEPLGPSGKIAFMFPGEGSAYTNMMADLCLHFPAVRAAFDEMNQAISARNKKPRYLPTDFEFPATLLTDAEKQALEAELWKVDSGLQAILASSLAMKDLLAGFNIFPDMIVGHSAGEYSAWVASGILQKADLYRNQEKIAAIYADRSNLPETAMAAVSAGYDKVLPIVEATRGEIYISNDNCLHQVIVVGEADAMDRFRERLKTERILYTDLPSKEVHHTPLAAAQAEPLTRAFSELEAGSPQVPVFSAMAARPYPSDRQSIIDLMVRYWTAPLQFRKSIEKMYRDGARIFVEVGPGSNLSGFVDDTLRGFSFMSAVSNSSRRSGTAQLCHLLGMLAAQHVPVSIEPLLAAQKEHAERHGNSRGQPEPGRKKGLTLNMDLGLPELKLPEVSIDYWQTAFERKPEKSDESDSQKSRAEAPEPNGRSLAMSRYMETMGRFLELHREVTLSLAARNNAAAGADRAVPGREREEGGEPPSGTGRMRLRPGTDRAMTGRVLDLSPGRFTRIERKLNLEEDLLLRDHPFGGEVSELDPELSPLIVAPLTLNMEMMAEAGALLFPDQVLTQISGVKAARWVVVDEAAGALMEASAEAASDHEAVVKLYEQESQHLFSARMNMAFSDAYPAPDAAPILSHERLSREAARQARQMYDQKLMTHGRRFQVVAGLIQTGAHEITAALRVPEEKDLFAANPAPELVLNPVLMDACAQLTGCWAQKNLKKQFITFPAGVEAIRFFSPAPAPGAMPACRMHVREISEQFVRSDIIFCHENGSIWAEAAGWTHRRFDLPLELYRFWRYPRLYAVSRMAPISEHTSDAQFKCRTPYYDDLDKTMWKQAIAHLYLNRSERRVYREKRRQEKDAGRWLTERMAAKDAVRILLNKALGRTIPPADIEIFEQENGYLIPDCRAIPELDGKMLLAVTRKKQFVSAALLRQVEIMEKEGL